MVKLNQPHSLVRMFFGAALLSSIGFGSVLLALIVGIDLGLPDLALLITGVGVLLLLVVVWIFQEIGW